MYWMITLATAALVTALVLVLFARRTDASFFKGLRVMTVLFCAIGFFRFMLCDGFIYVINGGLMDTVYYESTDVLSTVLRWGYFAHYAVLPMAVFTKSRLFRNLACYYCLPFAVLSAVFFERFMPYFLQDTGRGIFAPPAFRYAYFVLELVLAMAIVLCLAIRERHLLRVRDAREWGRFLISLPFVAFLTMPSYVPQALVGYSSLRATTFGTYHLVWLAVLAVATLVLYHIFRFRSREDRYNLCLFLSLVLFFHYNSLYLMGFNLPRLPIQLCNLAAFFYMLVIPLKLPRFFQFCFIVNVTGTLIAILSPDFATTGLGFWNLHYIFEHSLVLMIPVLAMGLRIFPRLTRRSLKYMLIGFSCYFVFCVIGGGMLNIFSDYTGEEVNYFFMFDLDKAKSFVSFIGFVDVFSVTLGAYTFYPLMMIFVFIAFLMLCLVFYRFTLFCYTVEDDHLRLRNAGLDLLEQRRGRPTGRPRDFQD
ncbi:MAG: YwaF family protein [Clostridia bacterium]|nr:YwaF family protein [Clostridia bacterium]